MAPKKKSDETDIYKLAMEKYKYEVAEKLGLKGKVDTTGWDAMTAAECGKIGGKMGGRLGENLVRKMMEKAQAELEPGQRVKGEATCCKANGSQRG